MSLVRCLTLSALLALPAAAQAQDGRLTERLDAATAARVQQVVDSARRAGLPNEPLVQKALEGATLGASNDRIVAAVQSLHGQLRRARGALGGDASDAELTAAAGSTAVGPGGVPVAGVFNLPATIVVLLVAGLLLVGISQSARANTVLVIVKVMVLILFVALGASYVQRENLTPFLPPNTGTFGEFGWSGVMRGAGAPAGNRAARLR